MPTYCYQSEDGHVIERFFPMGKAPRAISVKCDDGDTRIYAKNPCLDAKTIGVQESYTTWLDNHLTNTVQKAKADGVKWK